MDPTLATCGAGCRCFCHLVSQLRHIGQTGVCGTQHKSITQAWSNLQRGEKCICMISSPCARLQNLPVTNHRGQVGAGMALGNGLGRGGRVKTSPVMESRAEPSRGSCGSIIATLCDVAMAARAVPAWFPDV